MQLILRPPNTEVILREIAELWEYIPLALRLAGPLLAVDSEYTLNELKCELEKNPTSALGVKSIMEIAFEKLEEFLQRALVYLSVFPQSFKRDAAEAILDKPKEKLSVPETERSIPHSLVDKKLY